MADYQLDALSFWAKTTLDDLPGIDVFHHTVHVGLVARGIAAAKAERLDQLGLTPGVVAALAALHDIGKISPGFQCKCQAWLVRHRLTEVATYQNWVKLENAQEHETHDQVSQFTVQNMLVGAGMHRRDAKIWAIPVGAHHSTPRTKEGGVQPRCGMSIDPNDTRDADWEAFRQATAKRIVAAVGELPRTALAQGLDDPALWWLAGLISIADWIGSDERFFPSDRNPPRDESESLVAKALAAIGLDAPIVRPGLEFTDYFPFGANDLQRQAVEVICDPGLYVIEAPMGMGKTEAALACAYRLIAQGKASGIYFALPTQVTSNRIHIRVQAFLDAILADTNQGERARLIHANSWLVDPLPQPTPVPTAGRTNADADARAGVDWFASRKRALLANFGVGTVDQALLAIVAARHFFVRQFGLAGKVVVIDEVHSYDFYTGTLIQSLCDKLLELGCTVIVLSATLDGARRAALLKCAEVDDNAPYPLITGRTSSGALIEPRATESPSDKAVAIEFVDGGDAIRRVFDLACDGACVLWICDTVASAQLTFARFESLVGESDARLPELGLLHSRFPQFVRDAREKHCMEALAKPDESEPSKRPSGCILVSTQVVEQSVDLDADLLVTELAPTDMLLQRIGRLWRHARSHRPLDEAQCWIVSEAFSMAAFDAMNKQEIRRSFGSKAWVYSPYVLLRSLEVWLARNGSNVIIPTEIRALIRDTYLERDEANQGRDDWLCEFKGDMTALRQFALIASNLSGHLLEDMEGAQTRVSAVKTVQLVLSRALTGKRVTLLNGEDVDLSDERFVLWHAKALHRNICKIDKNVFEVPFKSSELTKRYVKGDQALAVIGDDGSLGIPGCKLRRRLRWSEQLGLVSERTTKKARDDEPCD